jgi:hypothetical protein
MSIKSIVLKGFNSYFFEFLDTVISYFPERDELQTSKTLLETAKRANPTILIKVWFSHVCTPYVNEINNADFDFFLHKDYSNDVNTTPNVGIEHNKIIDFIDKMREPMKYTTPEQKNIIFTYVQNLSKMSFQYSSI